MSKILKLHLLMVITMLNARGIESEIGINVGLNSTKNEDSNKFKNPNIGLTYQDNKYIVVPRIDIDYTKVKNDYANTLLKVSLNGVYEYDNNTYTTPYALAGLGYEYVDGATTEVFESHPFVQAGVGMKVAFNKGLELGIEAKALKIIGGHNEGNEFMLTVGVSMPLNYFSKRSVKRIVRPRPQVIRPIEPILVHEPIKVINSNNNECSIKIASSDFDRDGVADSIDQCPATPCNFTVDNYGCPVKTTLKINFASGSAQIRSSSQFQVNQFAQYLLKNRGSRVRITGHTDSRGSAEENLVLSKKRANAIVFALGRLGVSLGRLEAFGKGESMPISSNISATGRAINRRIEAELFYPEGRR